MMGKTHSIAGRIGLHSTLVTDCLPTGQKISWQGEIRAQSRDGEHYEMCDVSLKAAGSLSGAEAFSVPSFSLYYLRKPWT